MEATKVKTIWYTSLEASRGKSTVYTPADSSTLNEYFGISTGEVLGGTEKPEVGFLVIGRGGHGNISGVGGAALTDYYEHRITDACLFEHLPFVLRPVGSDLTATERANYRLRKLVSYNSVDYIAYYAKALDADATTTEIKKITIVDGAISTTEDFTTSTQQLTPTPVTMVNGVINRATGEHIIVSDKISATIDTATMNEILNAATIIYGDNRYAQITELALASGFDRSITSTIGGTAVTYTEIIASQCCVFVPTDYSLVRQTTDIAIRFNVGNSLQYVY